MLNTPKARSRGYKPGERPWTACLYILPGFIIYAVFVLWPILDTLRYSFYEWSGFSSPSFIGLDNYIKLYSDEIFRKALVNNLWFIVFYTVFPIVIGLFLTALMTRRRLPGMTLFRTGLFMPYVMAMVVVGVVWRWIYNPATGPLNQALRAVGLDALARPWLGDFDLALPAVGVVGTWVQFGFCMVLFIAGVQRIDEMLYDAAKLDGANEWRQFWHITLPGLRNEISVAMVTTLIAALRIFDLVFVTTRGGPGNETMVVALHIYRNAFAINRVGYAAAIAVVLTIVIVIISVGVLALRQKWVED
ncbi:MAG: sugar ABC transporter permease [Anaerolineales bacterium]|nr:sugar ABC transporter permease [Anaerolineales bacterium]